MRRLINSGKNSIGQKIFTAMLCVIVLTVLSFFISTYFIMNYQMERKGQESARKDLTIITEKMDMFFGGIEEVSVKMLASDACQRLLSESNNFLDVSEKQKHDAYQRINETLQSVFTQDAIYRTINFYDLEANAYPELNIELDKERRITQQSEIEAFLKGGENEKWLSMHKSPWAARNDKKEENCISYLRKVYAGRSGKLIGVMELEINAHAILDLYTTISEAGNSIYILDTQQQVQSSSNREAMYEVFRENEWYQALNTQQKEATFQVISRNDYLYMMKDYAPLKWQIIMAIPMSIYKRDIKTFTIVDITISILLLGIGIIMARKLILSITKPLSNITHTIQEIGKGDLEKRIEGEYEGEIQALTVEFNKMLDRTNHLMEQNLETEKKKRKIERSLIQLQMTPHFFYNILESICGLIIIDDKKLAIHTIQLLSNFYRNVLSKGAERIPLARELEIATNYLDIMKICYPDMFQYEIQYEEGVQEYQIVKLTLQPLLENAVYHGIIAQGKGGNIRIEIKFKEEDIEIIIADNGGGIPPDKLVNLMKEESDGFSMNSFGVRNTDERLKLHFGERYGLKIVSEAGQGTRVKMQIPRIRE